MEKHVLYVQGMSCGHCKMTVEHALKALPGVVLAEVDLDKHILYVEYDGKKLDMNCIYTTIEEEGYSIS